jgi:hypothetical protein
MDKQRVRKILTKDLNTKKSAWKYSQRIRQFSAGNEIWTLEHVLILRNLASCDFSFFPYWEVSSKEPNFSQLTTSVSKR